MWTVTSFCFATVALLSVISAQPDCTALDVGNTEPSPGTDLPVCATEDAQCCSADYLMSIQMKVRMKLERFLGEEFEDVIDEYQDEVEDLLEYFTEYFPEILLGNLPFSDVFNRSDPLIRGILRNLIENLEIDDDDDEGSGEEDEEENEEGDNDDDDEEEEESDDGNNFNVRDFVEALLEGVAESLGRDFTGRGNVVPCVARVFRDLLDSNVVGRITSQLQQVRRAITALMRVRRFLGVQRNRLDGVSVLEQCVTRLIELSYCQRCTERTPPLCFRTCNALARACYSPYFTVLNEQYRELWEQVQRIVRQLNGTLSDLFNEEGSLLDTDRVVSEILSECGVRMGNGMGGGNSPRRRKQTDGGMEDGDGSGDEDTSDGDEDSTEDDEDTTGDDTTGDSDSSSLAREVIINTEVIPFGLVDDIFALNGAFAYGRRIAQGLALCRDALIDDSTSCPANPEDQPSCEGMDFCTSQCFCTDGMEFTRDNETDQVFDGSDVDDQGENPVIVFDAGVLQAEANRITAMGDPVTAFLNSEEFTSVDPTEGPGDGGGDGGGNTGSAGGVGASLSVLLLAVLMITLL